MLRLSLPGMACFSVQSFPAFAAEGCDRPNRMPFAAAAVPVFDVRRGVEERRRGGIKTIQWPENPRTTGGDIRPEPSFPDGIVQANTKFTTAYTNKAYSPYLIHAGQPRSAAFQ